MSWRFGQWPRILLCGRSSFQDKSLRSGSPNMRAIWFLVCQSQSSLLQGCKLSCRSRNERNSGRFSVKDTQIFKAFMIKLYRSKDSGKVWPNHIILVEITLFRKENANTKKYNGSTLHHLCWYHYSLMSKCKYQEIQLSHIWEINKQVKWNHFHKPNKNCLANFPSILYLCAISFHNRGPSSTSASEVSHITINWNVSWPKHQRVHLALGRPFMDGEKCTRKQMLHNFCLNNISFSHYVHIGFDLLSTCLWHNRTGQHNFG